MKLPLSLIFAGISFAPMLYLLGDEKGSEVREPANSPAYHDDWGPGRGFEPGQTVPDIPLIDLEGREVRFDAFLGKRYVLYGWASW